MMRFAKREYFIVFALLALFLTGPAEGKVSPDAGAAFTDYGSMLGEYHSAGAFKFYDNTEALLRLAQFELSLMRYRFLKGQIQRRGDYRGLLAMVNLRLQFLKKQLHLNEFDIAAIPPRKARIPKVKPAVIKPPEAKPPEKPAAAKPAIPKAADKAKAGPSLPGTPPAVVIIPRPPDKAVAAPQATPQTVPPAAPQAVPPAAPPVAPQVTTEKPPDVVVTDNDTPKSKEKKAEEEKEEAKPPPPPPSFWEKLKIRLHLKKKAAD